MQRICTEHKQINELLLSYLNKQSFALTHSSLGTCNTKEKPLPTLIKKNIKEINNNNNKMYIYKAQ